MLKPSHWLLTLMASSLCFGVFCAPAADTPGNGPALLPGKGLAEHDFFYAGEAKAERMFIVRKGQVIWSHTHPGKGEISDAVLLLNGNILFARQFGITEINQDKQVVWNLDAPPIQAIEVTPEKKGVWALRSWTAPAALGPATTIQVLDGAPDAAH